MKTQISAAALVGSLAEWNKLRSALAAMPVVRKVDVLRLSHRDAQLQIEKAGVDGAQLHGKPAARRLGRRRGVTGHALDRV